MLIYVLEKTEMQVANDDYKLTSIPFFEQDLHDKVSAEIAEYYKYCPEERRLSHGDFGFGNVISDGKKLTGVIDWHPSMYGDPLFDVAWLDFWAYQQEGYAEFFKQHYKTQERSPDNFEQRLTCYELIIGANSLCFFAKSEQQEKYEFAKQALAKIKR